MIERRRLWWRSLLRPSDARGRESRTLFFVAVSVWLVWMCVAAVIWKFLEPGSAITVGEFAAAITVLTAAFATCIGVWLGREWIDAKRGNTDA